MCALLAWDSRHTHNELHAATLTIDLLMLYLRVCMACVIRRWLRATRFVFKGFHFPALQSTTIGPHGAWKIKPPIFERNESNLHGTFTEPLRLS